MASLLSSARRFRDSVQREKRGGCEGSRLKRDASGRRRRKAVEEAEKAVQEVQEVQEMQQQQQQEEEAVVVVVVEEEKRQSSHGKQQDKQSSRRTPVPRRGMRVEKSLLLNDTDPKSSPVLVSRADGVSGEDVEDGRQPSTSTSRSRVAGIRQGTRRSGKTRLSAVPTLARPPGDSRQSQIVAGSRKPRAEVWRVLPSIEMLKEGWEEEDEELIYDGDTIRVWLPWADFRRPVEHEPELDQAVEAVAEPMVEPEVEPEREPNVEVGVEPDVELEITVQDDAQADQDLPEVTTEDEEEEEAYVPQEAIGANGGAGDRGTDVTEPATPPLSLRAFRANEERRLRDTALAENGKQVQYFAATAVTPTQIRRSSRRKSSLAFQGPPDRRTPSEQEEELTWNAPPLSPTWSSPPPSHVRRRKSFAIGTLARAGPKTPAPRLRRTKSGPLRKKRDNYWSKMPELDSMCRNMDYYYPEGSSPVHLPATPLAWRAELRRNEHSSLTWADTPSRSAPDSGLPPHSGPRLGSVVIPLLPSPAPTLDYAPPSIFEPGSPPPPPSPLRFSLGTSPEINGCGINNLGGGGEGITSGDENAALFAPIPGNPLRIGSAAFIPRSPALHMMFPGPRPFSPQEAPLPPPEIPCQICHSLHLGARWEYDPCGHHACEWCWYTVWETSQVRNGATENYADVSCGVCKEIVVELQVIGTEERWSAVGEVVKPQPIITSVRKRYKWNPYGTPEPIRPGRRRKK
ncbi:hypothetical protein BZA05DRAFT_5225 [Tricharina praecox]|uniref:uncharacterized protein n=1 Tax=Tricharina praecox TaxID=43433 RepID=UPI002220DF97|nr:uncharacterized protein BZA05DRAFT_5225 [Tricharina praecox]KAI5858486.1 hypothetical protein BZA05DRAFT_5225 [Tricharina praecox]